jgi:hypothetical protein
VTAAAALEGDADTWDHDAWVAAWGRNAPLILCDRDLSGMPAPPHGTAWLATRALVGGRRVAELALLRADGGATLARGRVEPDVGSVVALAQRFLQGIAP